MGSLASPYNLSFLFHHVYMIGGATCLGGLPGLPVRVTPSAGVVFWHVNTAGVKFILHLQVHQVQTRTI